MMITIVSQDRADEMIVIFFTALAVGAVVGFALWAFSKFKYGKRGF